ncbi:MAG: HEAT repeat domain-containing protein [Planctomycetes bacterium]|nr:HEAT repeat domain-containing protein [Planctomycetota bacterium]HON43912.1 HEAT repeat domain-containing protein [Planctomycetota bacterium]HPY75916.1 HEAT repeat domain-containing protein [Planctomycetota bacterium]HQB01461.1 HEAT repeat domain-containing protein [Planctomycetota bacterium]HRU51808.1 HEAT repeat domain-containing protein [Planctomycetota bacterium]
MGYLISQKIEKNTFSHQEILTPHFWEQKLLHGHLSDRSILIAFFPIYLIEISKRMEEKVDADLTPPDKDSFQQDRLIYFEKIISNDIIEPEIALEMVEPKKLAEYWGKIIHNENAYLKIIFLQKIQNDAIDYKKYIFDLLNDKNEFVKMEAIKTCEYIKEPNTLNYLYPYLQDTSPYIRVQTCQTLGKLNYLDSVPYMWELLHDSEAYVRRNVAEVLKKLTNIETNYQYYESENQRKDSVIQWKIQWENKIQNINKKTKQEKCKQ